MDSTKRRVSITTLAAGGLVLLLVVEGWRAASCGIADAYARPALTYLRQQMLSETGLSKTAHAMIVERLVAAQEINPYEPEVIATLGFMEQVRFAQELDSLEVPELAEVARAASEYYESAAHLRPTWPYYWANIASEQYKLGRQGEALFGTSLANAARFGPWKDDNQSLVADLGALNWSALDDTARGAVARNLSRTLVRQPDAIMSSELLISAMAGHCEYLGNAQSAFRWHVGPLAHIADNNSEIKPLEDFCEATQRSSDENS